MFLGVQMVIQPVLSVLGLCTLCAYPEFCPAKYFPCCHADNKPNSSKDSFHLVSMVHHFWLSFLSRMKTSNLIYKSDFFVETEICFAKKKKPQQKTLCFFFAFKVYQYGAKMFKKKFSFSSFNPIYKINAIEKNRLN